MCGRLGVWNSLNCDVINKWPFYQDLIPTLNPGASAFTLLDVLLWSGNTKWSESELTAVQIALSYPTSLLPLYLLPARVTEECHAAPPQSCVSGGKGEVTLWFRDRRKVTKLCVRAFPNAWFYTSDRHKYTQSEELAASTCVIERPSSTEPEIAGKAVQDHQLYCHVNPNWIPA